MKIAISLLGDEQIIIKNVKITKKHKDGIYDAVGDGWSATESPLIGLTDDDGNPISPDAAYVPISETELHTAQLKAISDYQDFLEECIVEMACRIYAE